MGDLPANRLDNSSPYPFIIVGVDIAGPFHIRKGHTRCLVAIKSYLCLFVCMLTKAVHLELCTELCMELSCENFLAAFNRFTDRWGLPHSVYSDNGRNFTAVAKDISDCFKLLHSTEFQQSISLLFCAKSIHWHFSPARAPPHFGGLWEARVKAAKTILKKVLPAQHLTYEEFLTVLTSVEATLNSRPLTRNTMSTTDGSLILTAGYFLIGRPLLSLPQSSMENTPPSELEESTKHLTNVLGTLEEELSSDSTSKREVAGSNTIPSCRRLCSSLR